MRYWECRRDNLPLFWVQAETLVEAATAAVATLGWGVLATYEKCDSHHQGQFWGHVKNGDGLTMGVWQDKEVT